MTTPRGDIVALAEGRCFCQRCTGRTGNMYRMIGKCSNCTADPILMLYRAGDKAAPLDCPLCGVYRTVQPYRRATDNEIPASAPPRVPPARAPSFDEFCTCVPGVIGLCGACMRGIGTPPAPGSSAATPTGHDNQ